MTALTLIITNAGRAALVDAIAGGTTAVTIAEAGLTASSFVAAPTLTALPGEFGRVDSVAGIPVDDTTVHLIIRDSGTDAYTVRGVGLYLDDGTLFAVYSQTNPILEKSEVSTFLLAADLRFLPGEADNVVFGDTNFLNPPASETVKGVAYLATLAEVLAGLVDDKIITPATLGTILNNYVLATKLGVANGVATLGPDGKLLVSQRPPIDLIDVFAVSSQSAMLALAATVGDFAVRSDNGLIYVLQATPATTLGNWLEISTPAPVSSVNGKVGTVVLNPDDIGAPPNGRTISGGGLATGGGDLSANRTITVPAASQGEAEAGTDGTKALTPLSIAGILGQVGGKVPNGRVIGGSGLVTGGGDLSANRTLDVAIANASEILAGIENGKAVTPASLAGLPKSLTPNGFYMFPGGLIMQWVAYRNFIPNEMSIYVAWPIVFPNGVLPGSATAWLAAPSITRNLFAQICNQDRFGAQIQLQKITDNEPKLDGFDVLILGY